MSDSEDRLLDLIEALADGWTLREILDDNPYDLRGYVEGKLEQIGADA